MGVEYQPYTRILSSVDQYDFFFRSFFSDFYIWSSDLLLSVCPYDNIFHRELFTFCTLFLYRSFYLTHKVFFFLNLRIRQLLSLLFCRLKHLPCSLRSAAFLTQMVSVDSAMGKFEIWDTAGQELYHSLAPTCYRGAQAAIVVYDITSTV